MKKMIAFLLLLLALPLQALAAETVQSMVDALPAVDVLQEMDMEQQREVYDRTQTAYDAYLALTDEEQEEIPGARETFESLFGYFNTLVAPAEEAAEEAGTGSELLSTVIACLAGLFLARKLVTKRKL